MNVILQYDDFSSVPLHVCQQKAKRMRSTDQGRDYKCSYYSVPQVKTRQRITKEVIRQFHVRQPISIRGTLDMFDNVSTGYDTSLIYQAWHGCVVTNQLRTGETFTKYATCLNICLIFSHTMSALICKNMFS